MKILNAYRTMEFDVELSQPDTGTIYDCISITWDETTDDLKPTEFNELVCSMIWDELNYGRFYHEMILRHFYIIDDSVYITSMRYNGYEVEKLPTVIKHIS